MYVCICACARAHVRTCAREYACVRICARVCMCVRMCVCVLTRRDREVIDFTRSRVKNDSKLTNLMKMYQIEGYNGK